MPVREVGQLVGRRQQLAKIFSYLTGGASVSIVGERKTGKTSLMQVMAFNKPVRESYDFGPERAVFAYMDGQVISATAKSFWKSAAEAIVNSHDFLNSGASTPRRQKSRGMRAPCSTSSAISAELI